MKSRRPPFRRTTRWSSPVARTSRSSARHRTSAVPNAPRRSRRLRHRLRRSRLQRRRSSPPRPAEPAPPPPAGANAVPTCLRRTAASQSPVPVSRRADLVTSHRRRIEPRRSRAGDCRRAMVRSAPITRTRGRGLAVRACLVAGSARGGAARHHRIRCASPSRWPPRAADRAGTRAGTEDACPRRRLPWSPRSSAAACPGRVRGSAKQRPARRRRGRCTSTPASRPQRDTVVEHRWYRDDRLHQRVELRIRANAERVPHLQPHHGEPRPGRTTGKWNCAPRMASVLHEEIFSVQ